MDLMNFMNYIDDIRRERKMIIPDLVQDITSEATYRRYLNGNSMNTEVIVKLAERLGFAYEEIVDFYKIEYKMDSQLVENFLNSVINDKLTEYPEYVLILKRKRNLDYRSKYMLSIAEHLLKFNNRTITRDELIDSIKKEINFDKIIDSNLLLTHEIYILGIIITYGAKDADKILDKLIKIYETDKFVKTDNVIHNSRNYYKLVKSLYIHKNYSKLIEIATNAINYIKDKKSLYLLTEIYYFRTVSYFMLGNIKQFEESLEESASYIYCLNKTKKQYFIELIKTNTDYDLNNFYISRLTQNS